jgi:uncharacterized protein (DUF736 family)
VEDALSRKSYEKAVPKSTQLQEEMARLNMHIVPQGYVRQLSVQPTLEEKIRKAQETDEDLMKIRKHAGENKAPDFRVDDQGTLGIRIGYAYLKAEISDRPSWMRLTTRHTPFTRDPPRCIWI